MIQGNRINLYPLSLNDLRNIISGSMHIRDFNFDQFELEDVQLGAINKKIEKMSKVPEHDHVWYTYWLIASADSNEALGMIGFKGFEDNNSFEVGYGISKHFEGHGYMSEAIGVLMDWSFSRPECTRITAKNVLVDNVGSQRVLLKNGFKIFNQTDTTIDFEVCHD